MEIGDTNNSVGNGNTRSLLLCILNSSFNAICFSDAKCVQRTASKKRGRSRHSTAKGNEQPWQCKTVERKTDVPESVVSTSCCTVFPDQILLKITWCYIADVI